MWVVRDEKEIKDLFDRAADAAMEPSQWPGMSFEDGVMATMEWLIDSNAADPLVDE